MEFRRFGKNEIDLLVKARILYLREDFKDATEEQFSEIEKNLYGYFEKHIENDLFAFGAAENGEIISAALLLIIEKPCNPSAVTGKTGEVFSVYTRPEYRRQGIAMKVLKMLINFAEENKLNFVNLKATQDGYPLYKKLGFTEEHSHYVPMKITFDNQV